jgi:hypothetical protein
MMRMLAALALLFALAQVAALAQSVPALAQATYLNTLQAGGAINSTDTFPICQTASGCGKGVKLSQETVSQLTSYFKGIFLMPPLTLAEMPAAPPRYIAASDSLTAADLDRPVCLRGSTAAATLSIPAAGTSGFTAGAEYLVCNLDANPLTLAAVSGTLLGAVANPLGQGMWALLDSDGTDWLVMETGGAGPALTTPVLAVGP